MGGFISCCKPAEPLKDSVRSGHVLPGENAPVVYDISTKGINGQPFSFADHKGKVIVVVNVASYRGLEILYQTHKERGLVIVGFPCNQFLSQEPGSEEEIASFCRAKYNVTFPILAKGDVNGDDTHPLYVFMKSQLPGKVAWNFEKFIIDRQGHVVERYNSYKTPEKLEDDIKKFL